jgi:hypothetical protein
MTLKNSVTPGSYTVTFTGVGGGLTKTATFNISVKNKVNLPNCPISSPGGIWVKADVWDWNHEIVQLNTNDATAVDYCHKVATATGYAAAHSFGLYVLGACVFGGSDIGHPGWIDMCMRDPQNGYNYLSACSSSLTGNGGDIYVKNANCSWNLAYACKLSTSCNKNCGAPHYVYTNGSQSKCGQDMEDYEWCQYCVVP